jgi:diadenosine tetraphosphatase ApaH/serine/threonine PP2A family protein phosphatase
MRVAVISDIHANLHALEAVLASIDEEKPDAMWCLGDLVGYGPRPNECCAIVRERADICLVGNHDLGVVGRVTLEDFAGDAYAAATWTREALEEHHVEFLNSLEPSAVVDAAELFHGSPLDHVWHYVLDSEAARWSFRGTTKPLVLVGHSHFALKIDDELHGGRAPDGTELDLSERRWLLNPGSVGQPRDGDPRAAWLLLDLARRFASFRRVAYPIERTQSEMRANGLPEPLAARLAVGQ